jgi:hypothetical protein
MIRAIALHAAVKKERCRARRAVREMRLIRAVNRIFKIIDGAASGKEKGALQPV